ncbi:glycosyltransferase [Vibrio splendidus]
MISIITVCYNNLQELKETVSSVLAQNCSEYELVIVDGGSDKELIDYLSIIVTENKNRKINVISEPDRGPYDAMNKGLLKVTGSHVIFMNSGDTFHDVSDIESYLSYTDDFDIIYGDFHANRGGVLYHRKSKLPCYFETDFKYMGFCHQSVAVSTKLFESGIGCEPFSPFYKIAADFNFMYPILQDVNIKKKYLDKSTSNFLVGGISDSQRLNSLLEHLYIYRTYNPITKRCLLAWSFLFLKEFVKGPIRRAVRKK